VDRYDIRVMLYGYDLDLADAVSRPISLTNGRQDLTTPVGKAYGQVTFLKRRLNQIVSGPNLSPEDVDFGSRIQISVITPVPVLLFDGCITDISANAEEITFSLVETQSFNATRGVEYSWVYGLPAYTGHLDDIFTGTTGTGILDKPNGGAIDTFIPVKPGTTSNPYSYANEYLSGLQALTLFYDPNLPGWFLEIRNLYNEFFPPKTPRPTLEIGERQVVRNYDIQRQIGTVANEITADYFNTTTQEFDQQYSRTNQTSVDRIGTRKLSIQTNNYQLGDVQAFVAWALGNQSPYGYPIVEFTTTIELLRESPSLPSGDLDELLPFLVPGQILDTSALVNNEGFSDRCFIEQVTHVFDRSSWDVDLIVSNAAYSGQLQPWWDVPASISWEDVLNDPPQVITWDSLLYQNLGV
jgi:hypothetical protein